MSTATDTSWAKPQADITDLDIAFGVRALELMPAMADIPEEFKTWPGGTWNRFQADWFFKGLRPVRWEPRGEVDVQLARRHLAAIQSSWEPKHEHKQAAVAYLASLWFVRVITDDNVYGDEVPA